MWPRQPLTDMQDRACGSRSKPMTATATTMVKAVWQSYFNNPEGQSKPLEQLLLMSDGDYTAAAPGLLHMLTTQAGTQPGGVMLARRVVAIAAAADALAADSTSALAAAPCCLLQ